MGIKNTKQGIESEIEFVVIQILDAITERVIRIFKNEYILKYVYIPNPKMYERTMNFLDAWEWTPTKKQGARIIREMFYNPDVVKANIPKYQHGSIYSTPEDVSHLLMEILDKRGRSSSLWLSNGVNRKEAYFKKFIADMLSGGELSKIMDEEFIKRGFIKA